MIFRRVAQEINNLGQLLLGLILAGDVGERYLRTLRVMLLGPRPAESEDILLTPRHLTTHEHDQADDEQERQEGDEQSRKQRGAIGFPLDCNAVLVQERKQPGVLDGREGGAQAIPFGNALGCSVRRGCHQLLAGAVPGYRLLQLGRDCLVGQGHFADVSRPNLLLDHRVRNGDALGISLRIEDRVELIRHQSEEEHRDRPGRNARTPLVAGSRSARSEATPTRKGGSLARGPGR
ncbi:MAG: hypothetical protein K0R44_762 [Thermomicrobiales bacterium]|nr:hypothetical protein [Thermomicrobiales bacterium]